MAEFSVNNPNGYLAGPLGNFRVYGADGRLKAIGAGGGGGATWGTITGNILNQTDLIDYITNHSGTGYVPDTRNITINGSTYDLSADRTWNVGTVTSVSGTGNVSGITLSGSFNNSGSLQLGGTLVLTQSDITTGLGYTPYNATNPNNYINQTTASTLYYPLSTNPSNYLTSSTAGLLYYPLSTNPAGYLTAATAGSLYQPIFTTQNGLTYSAGYLKLGGLLTENTTIDGYSSSYDFNITNLNASTNTAAYSYSFATSVAGVNTLLSLDSGTNVSKFSHQDSSANVSAIELTGAQLRVQTPAHTTKTAGDVLTLTDPATGEAEWQTPTTGSGGISFAIASGTDTYTASISGVTSYADGDAYIIRFTNGNTTGCTLDINGLGAITLYRNNDGALIGGDIWDGAEMLVVYNSALAAFDCIGTSPNSLFSYVTNGDTVSITKGQAVYASGGTGDRLKVKLAYNTSDATSAQTIGLVVTSSIATNQKGIIIMQGLLSGLSILPTSTWSDGDPVYLGATAGSITPTKQYAPNHLVYLGFVTSASNGSSGRLYVKPQNGYEMDELHNVQAQSPSNKDTLWYDSTVTPKQWKTASISTILGYTPVTDARTISTTSPLSGGGDLSADRTLSITQATTSTNGYLSSTDWNTFNGKQNSVGFTSVGTAIATLTDPSAIRYLRINANNSVTAIDSATLRSELGFPSGTMVRLEQLSDQSITTSDVTPVTLTNLQFTITSGKKYKIRANIIHSSSNGTSAFTTGVNASVSVASVYQQVIIATGTTSNAISIMNMNSLGTAPSASGASAGILLMTTIDCVLNANNTGTAYIQFRKQSAAPGTTTVKAGSIVEYYEY